MNHIESAAALREAGRIAKEGTELPRRGDGLSGKELDIDRVAAAEGWSVDDLGQAANEATGVNGPEIVPLLDSRGEVATMVSEAEKAIYDGAGLEARNVNGRETLVRDDIDWDRVDNYGNTNLERAERGLAPLDEQGQPYELHHVQQENDGQLAELTADEHRGDNDRILHDRGGPSTIDREHFNDVVRPGHWQARAAEVREDRE